jgi:hypothetical protein
MKHPHHDTPTSRRRPSVAMLTRLLLALLSVPAAASAQSEGPPLPPLPSATPGLEAYGMIGAFVATNDTLRPFLEQLVANTDTNLFSTNIVARVRIEIEPVSPGTNATTATLELLLAGVEFESSIFGDEFLMFLQDETSLHSFNPDDPIFNPPPPPTNTWDDAQWTNFWGSPWAGWGGWGDWQSVTPSGDLPGKGTNAPASSGGSSFTNWTQWSYGWGGGAGFAGGAAGSSFGAWRMANVAGVTTTATDPTLPDLDIAMAPEGVVLSWDGIRMDLAVFTAHSLATGPWTRLDIAPTYAGGRTRVVVPHELPSCFYKLGAVTTAP